VINIEIYTVWDKTRMGVQEKCLRNDLGSYIGLETGNYYSKEMHHHSEQLKGKIVDVDEENLTGMLHLSYDDDVNRKYEKGKYLGCYVTLEEAHLAHGLKVYRCLELNEYFSENEVELFN
jgi:hypothetical protein